MFGEIKKNGLEMTSSIAVRIKRCQIEHDSLIPEEKRHSTKTKTKKKKNAKREIKAIESPGECCIQRIK